MKDWAASKVEWQRGMGVERPNDGRRGAVFGGGQMRWELEVVAQWREWRTRGLARGDIIL